MVGSSLRAAVQVWGGGAMPVIDDAGIATFNALQPPPIIKRSNAQSAKPLIDTVSRFEP